MLEFLNDELKGIDIRVNEPLKNILTRKWEVQRTISLFHVIVMN